MKHDDPGCPQHVVAFVKSSIDSVVQLEMLLLLFKEQATQWTPETIARELRVDPMWVQSQLTQLCDRGLLRCLSGPSPAYQYLSTSASVDRTLLDLSKAYSDRRVSIISLIYSKPGPAQPSVDPLKCFSDAFRFRKDKPHG